MPEIGELIVVFAGPERVDGRFRGFDYDRIAFEPGNGGERREIELASLDSLLYTDGQSLYGTTLRRYVWQGWLPLLSAVSLRTNRGRTELVPRESVAYLETAFRGKATQGLLIGLAIDAAIIATVAIACAGGKCVTHYGAFH